MKSAIVWKLIWAAVGILALTLFFNGFEAITDDSPPLWLQVAVGIAGASIWLKSSPPSPQSLAVASRIFKRIAHGVSQVAALVAVLAFAGFIIWAIVRDATREPDDRTPSQRYIEENARDYLEELRKKAIMSHWDSPEEKERRREMLEAAEKELTH